MVLNAEHDGPGGGRASVAGALLAEAREIKAAALGADGVRYGPEVATGLEELGRLAGRLRRLDLAEALRDHDEALAFWINVYNALVIHGALASRVRRSVREVGGFFSRTAYEVGGLRFSLDAIEHGILRGNRGHPRRVVLPQFWPWDAGHRFVLQPMDVRIHFALNCGAISCPPIKSYSSGAIGAELDLAMRSFLSGGGATVDSATGKVVLSRIFLWYSRDFGLGKGRQMRWVLNHVEVAERERLQRAAKDSGITYGDYDWRFGA